MGHFYKTRFFLNAMKRFFLFALCVFSIRLLSAQDSLNMTRLARWDDPTLYTDSWLGLQYSGCWGLATGGRVPSLPVICRTACSC